VARRRIGFVSTCGNANPWKNGDKNMSKRHPAPGAGMAAMLARSAALAMGLAFAAGTVHAQQLDPFRPGRSDATTSDSAASEAPLSGTVDERLRNVDSVTYRLASSSRLQVRTGKAGLLGFAGHTHLIQARAFQGEVVYYPRHPSSSRVDITVLTDSLEVLTPPDTAEIRQVTASMRTRILRTAEFHEIRLTSRQITPTAHGLHVVAAVTMVGQTREVPIEVAVQIGVDTLEAATIFSLKQTDFGIKPFSGGPGGTVRVADRVTFSIHAVALRSAPEHLVSR
jgi:polyisoprenoid-binding protein YceI